MRATPFVPLFPLGSGPGPRLEIRADIYLYLRDFDRRPLGSRFVGVKKKRHCGYILYGGIRSEIESWKQDPRV